HDLVGYGGLVHINWSDKNAEISFLLDTAYNSSPENFKRLWTVYLELLPQIAFDQLNFKKIYTYAYETRAILFPILEENGFVEEARLKQHALVNGEYKDVIIHSLFNPKL
ncbi:MAG TPA: GNAT family protein, partial [Chitinophagales bacterium]|nr:GNAT family protein [Chitinophagales bacterium]